MNRNVVITGGTRGIGAGVAEVMSRSGWHVISAGVSEKEIAEFSGSKDIDLQLLDVTDDASVERLFSRFEKLDALVNCAGILLREKEYELDAFQKVIDVNLTGTMRCSLAAYPLLLASGGAIVNTASMLSFFGGPLVPAYSASKGGVAQLTKALAAKWAPDGIRVNAVAPGWIETEMTEGLRRDTSRNDTIVGRTPLNRWGQVEEVGALVNWLLSAEAGFVTGAVYPVDGGYSAV
ncbi:MAG: SDR family oxidoreductase [Roseibium sp.]|uniref:SDR family NAD(P)-dependent oxidoreductase n=1 Tax=Roseibium sp. TaxID=1936156 RepID=UPI002625B811|nr:SDR family oxidoreductase [Roseibium sp.]MCV0426659.1 SDR family oxidoreductase [Roseibium sp.]